MTAKIIRSQALGALSMTPLIDVVFLLLIFFLVASRLSQEDLELDIPLPSAANAMPMTAEPKELVVNVNLEGQVFINDQLIEPQDLEKLILKTVVDNPQSPAVIIRADRRVPLQMPVSIMDLCIKCGAAYSLSIADEDK
jgi:biopolymer transport protein ExbD